MGTLGLDIGGANLKLADGKGYAHSVPFSLWQKPEQLPNAIQRMLVESPEADSLAVTITGELADCFATKVEGIDAILSAAEQAAEHRSVSVYLCDGRVVSTLKARENPLLAAASNWHVLATFSGRYCTPGEGLLIDVGSTTCDIIPLRNGLPSAIGKTDPERLLSGELVYTGIERSPICAVVSKLPWQNRLCPVAQELFATTVDAYLLLGDLPEDPHNFETADSRSRTKANAHARIARAICADTTMFSLADAQQAAATIAEAQLTLLQTAVQQVLGKLESPPGTTLLSGHGEFLARRVIERLDLPSKLISLTQELGTEISRSACAHALAVLADEGLTT